MRRRAPFGVLVPLQAESCAILCWPLKGTPRICVPKQRGDPCLMPLPACMHSEHCHHDMQSCSCMDAVQAGDTPSPVPGRET